MNKQRVTRLAVRTILRKESTWDIVLTRVNRDIYALQSEQRTPLQKIKDSVHVCPKEQGVRISVAVSRNFTTPMVEDEDIDAETYNYASFDALLDWVADAELIEDLRNALCNKAQSIDYNDTLQPAPEWVDALNDKERQRLNA